jgi:hypothetical protein
MVTVPHLSKSATLYLHFPCFDGIVSGALAILFLNNLRGWEFDSIYGVNYDLQANWLTTHLSQRSCVIDFLYHPEAEVWCDHHTTTFLESKFQAEFETRPNALHWYDQKSRSTARLLWNRAAEALGWAVRLEEMVNWADKIDAADYENVNEAIFGSHPALNICRSLGIDADSKYCNFLVRGLCDLSLEELAAQAEVRQRVAHSDELSSEGLNRVKKTIRLHGNIAIFDTQTENAFVNRYSAFHFHPDAQYSIGTFRGKDSTTVRINANPWLGFQSPNLGQMMRAAAKKAGLGSGGGHERVGSLRLGKESHRTAEEIVAYLIKELHGDLEGKERSQWQRAVIR